MGADLNLAIAAVACDEFGVDSESEDAAQLSWAVADALGLWDLRRPTPCAKPGAASASMGDGSPGAKTAGAAAPASMGVRSPIARTATPSDLNRDAMPEGRRVVPPRPSFVVFLKINKRNIPACLACDGNAAQGGERFAGVRTAAGLVAQAGPQPLAAKNIAAPS